MRILLAEYREDEETMAALFRLYQEGVVCAPAEALTEWNGKPSVYTLYDSQTEQLGNPVAVEPAFPTGRRLKSSPD